MTKRFIAGLAGSPFGVDGRVKLQSLSGETEHIFRLKKVLLRKDGRETEYLVEAFFFRPLSVKLAGIDSPEAAKALQGAEIITGRAEAAPLSEGEFYIEDLKGLTVYASSENQGEDLPVGKIEDILEGGGGFLAEIALVSGERRLVPFRNEFFGEINIEKGCAELLVRWILD